MSRDSAATHFARQVGAKVIKVNSARLEQARAALLINLSSSTAGSGPKRVGQEALTNCRAMVTACDYWSSLLFTPQFNALVKQCLEENKDPNDTAGSAPSPKHALVGLHAALTQLGLAVVDDDLAFANPQQNTVANLLLHRARQLQNDLPMRLVDVGDQYYQFCAIVPGVRDLCDLVIDEAGDLTIHVAMGGGDEFSVYQSLRDLLYPRGSDHYQQLSGQKASVGVLHSRDDKMRDYLDVSAYGGQYEVDLGPAFTVYFTKITVKQAFYTKLAQVEANQATATAGAAAVLVADEGATTTVAAGVVCGASS